MKRGLNEQAWESMRSPEEIQDDEDIQRHEEGWCNPYCSICREKRREERTKMINEIAKSKLAFLGSWEEVQEYMKRGK